MNETFSALHELTSARGSLAKTEVLKKYKDNTEFKAALKFIYNPYVRCGISNAKLQSAINLSMTLQPEEGESPTLRIIDYLTHNRTGTNDDIRTVARYLAIWKTGPSDMFYASAIVSQDLQSGAGVKTINKVYGDDFIPVVGCMLGKPYEDKFKGPFIVTEKLDGIRRILVKEDGVIKMFSRSGHEDTGLVEIMREAELLPDNMVYDGELIAMGKYEDNIATRQATASIANSKGVRTGLVFNVFDCVPLDQFMKGTGTEEAFDRKAHLASIFNDKQSFEMLGPGATPLNYPSLPTWTEHIVHVPILGVVDRVEDASTILDQVRRRNGEGVMLNTFDGLYEIKRSSSLLKVKFSEEYALTVKGFEEGTGKYEGSLGAIICDYNGYDVKVGSGFTDMDRAVVWANPNDYVGKVAEIESFGESTNQQGGRSLNCPIFKQWRRSNF